MTVIGVLLVLVAVLVAVAMLAGAAEPDVQLALGPVDVGVPPSGVFLLGVATVLILVAGVILLRTGMRRSLRRRRELKAARAVVAGRDRHDQDTPAPGRHLPGAEPTTPSSDSGTGAPADPPTTSEPDTRGPRPDPDTRGSTS
ncbi:MAG: hypothetical protein M3165_00275 [Actinomycetota bacterium]|nr:hypothetical protein [Actinomycetota bacterium]